MSIKEIRKALEKDCTLVYDKQSQDWVTPESGFVIGMTAGVTTEKALNRVKAGLAHGVGSWFDGTRQVIDPVILVDNLPDALALGQLFRQTSIFCLDSSKCLNLDKSVQNEPLILANAIHCLLQDNELSKFKRFTQFYHQALSFARSLESESPASLSQVCAVIALLSPRIEWSRNKKVAEELLKHWEYGDFKRIEQLPIFKANVKKALNVLDDQFYDSDLDALVKMGLLGNGLKVQNFALNIIGDFSKVTIDSHMFNYFNLPIRFNSKQHIQAIELIKSIASCACLFPSTVQAVLWEVERLKKGVGAVDLEFSKVKRAGAKA